MTSKKDILIKKIESIKELIKKQYLNDDGNLPWLIGYSGGKDSTCCAQLVFSSIKEMKEEGVDLRRNIIIFTSNTMIENPLVKEIAEDNIRLINAEARKQNLPIDAYVLTPKMSDTYWVNIIGKGYPTPNTMFRWCTDRLKIFPANSFVKNRIDESGEVIMVLGVREGESDTRDRVLKNHNIEGETLMRHTTLSNAFVFAPIKTLDTIDVFLYLNVYNSPWGSDNKKLYFFYEESGAGECPIFLDKNDKTSSNSCGNSRLGCWCCTVVQKDKSLSGFIDTGWHNELKPLLNFRNWLAMIRDDENYRCFFRANGSVYTKKVDLKSDNNKRYLSIKNKGVKDKIEIRLKNDGSLDSDEYKLVPLKELSEYMKKNKLSFKDSKMAKIILFDEVTEEYLKLGTGPFNEKAKIEIFIKLLETEKEYNKLTKNYVKLIEDEEIIEIKKLWLKSSLPIKVIDDELERIGRDKVEIILDTFEEKNKMNETIIKEILSKSNLEIEVLNKLLYFEENRPTYKSKNEVNDFIDSVLKSDNINY